MTDVAKKPIRRSPRLLTGTEGAAIEKLLWTKPRFDVKVSSKPFVTEFRFRISLPRETAARYPVVKSLFFGPGARDFEMSLSRSYWESVSGKTVSRFIQNLLHLVFRNAIERWLKTGWSFESVARAEKDIQNYIRNAKSKRGQQPDPVLALWMVSRVNTLKKKIRAVRSAYSKRKVRGTAIWKLAEKVASRDVLRKVLTQLFDNPDNIEALFLDKRLTTNRTALAVLEVELAERGNTALKTRRVSLAKYLEAGNALQTRLAKIPQPPNARSNP